LRAENFITGYLGVDVIPRHSYDRCKETIEATVRLIRYFDWGSVGPVGFSGGKPYEHEILDQKTHTFMVDCPGCDADPRPKPYMPTGTFDTGIPDPGITIRPIGPFPSFHVWANVMSATVPPPPPPSDK